jgi:hypothetical protein
MTVLTSDSAETTDLSDQQRLDLLVQVLMDIVQEELECGYAS